MCYWKSIMLTRVCFILSPQFVKSRLENTQAIASFSWRNAWYHGASLMRKRKVIIALDIATFIYAPDTSKENIWGKKTISHDY